MSLVAWAALLLILAAALYAVWEAVREPASKPQPKHRASRRRPSGDRLTDYSYDDDGDWPKELWLDRPVTEKERAAAREFLAAMDRGERDD